MKVRVRADKLGGGYVVRHPEGYNVTLKPGDVYDSTDPIVKAFRWAFDADNVEQASAAPGERRNTTRGKQ